MKFAQDPTRDFYTGEQIKFNIIYFDIYKSLAPSFQIFVHS